MPGNEGSNPPTGIDWCHDITLLYLVFAVFMLFGNPNDTAVDNIANNDQVGLAGDALEENDGQFD